MNETPSHFFFLELTVRYIEVDHRVVLIQVVTVSRFVQLKL